MMTFDVEAYDWNCLQHLTPRFTAEEINEGLAPLKEHVAALETELEVLRNRVKAAGI